MQLANVSQFHLSMSSLGDAVLALQSLQCDDFAISSHYHIHLKFNASQQLDLNSLLIQQATLTINDASYYRGVIEQVRYLGRSAEEQSFNYEAVLASPLEVLVVRKGACVYVNKTVKDVVMQVLKEARFAVDKVNWQGKNLSPLPLIVQLNTENDLQFVERLLQFSGLLYVFIQNNQETKLWVGDAVQTPPTAAAVNLSYVPQSGQRRERNTIINFIPRFKAVSDHVQLKSYDEQTPEIKLNAVGKNQSNIAGKGVVKIYDASFKKPSQGEQQVRYAQYALDWQREQFVATTQDASLQLGQIFHLQNYEESALNQAYRIIAMRLQGDQTRQQDRLTFNIELTAIKATVPYLLPGKVIQQTNTTIPAMVESSGGKYAHLDAQGCYHVRMAFDRSDNPVTQASLPVRALQPTTGKHFPLLAGVQVSIGFINNNLQRPIITGVQPSSVNTSPVTMMNRTQHVVKTPAGNHLLIEDQYAAHHINLATEGQQNYLRLDAQQKCPLISLQSEQGLLAAYNHKQKTLTLGRQKNIQTGSQYQLKVNQSIKKLSVKKHIKQQSGKSILHKSHASLLLQSQTGGVEYISANNLQIKAQQNLSITVKQKDSVWSVNKGAASLVSHNDLLIKGHAGGDMTVGTPSANFVVNAGGSVVVKAKQIKINAPKVSIYGVTAVNG